MHPKIVAAGLGLALIASPAGAVTSTGSTAGKKPAVLLRAAMTAPQHISYEGEVQTLRIGRAHAKAAIYRVQHRAPNLTRRWYLAPQSLYGDSIIAHGSTTYSVDLARKRIVVSTDADRDDLVSRNDNLGLLMSNYHIVSEPDTAIDGHHAHVLALINAFTGATTMRLWIDSQTNLVLERERYGSAGAMVSQTRFTNIRFTNAIPTAMFDLPKHFAQVKGPSRAAPSHDYARIVRSAGFQARSPKYLPDGFFEIAGNVVEIKGVRSLQLLYSDGIRTVSLFENAKGAAVDLSHYKAIATTVAGHKAAYVVDGSTTLLAWPAANLHLALVGDLNRIELTKIASSIAH